MKKIWFSIAGCMIAMAGLSMAQGLIQDAFGNSNVTKDSVRVFETDIDGGWQADRTSLWTINDGSLKNTGTATSGIDNEGAVAQVVTLSGQSGRYLDLAFDYTGNANNTLTVHLWGYTGTFDGDGNWFANFGAQDGSYYNNWNRDPSTHGYSLKDGSDAVVVTPLVSLSGSGTYTNRIDIQSLGIPGVTDISDLTYLNLAFGRANSGGATSTTIDNINLYTGSSIWPIMTAATQSGQVPLSVAFDALASSAEQGIVSYDWNFGDGNTATGVLATNLYTTPGVYSAELTITDSSNQTALAVLEIVVAGTTDLGAIWFIGDSITQSNADGDGNGSPRKSLYDLLVANGYLFSYTGHFTANVDGLPTTGATAADNLYHYHSGISGSVIGDDYSGRVGMAQNMSTFWNSGRLAVVKPDIILILMGANDVNLELDLPGAPARLQAMIQTIYDLPGIGTPTIFLSSITPNRTDDPPDPANVAAFNAAVPGVVSGFIAQGRDVRLVDQFTPINTDYAANMRPDNLHPNAAGNEVMAQQWYNAITEQWPGTISDFHSFDLYTFTTNGLSCKVAVPDVVADGRPWIWRARFWDHQSGPDIALLSNGFHVAYVDVADLFGSPTAVARFDAFYDFLTQSYGLDHRTVLEGMSRGGLIIYNWAAQNTEKVYCVYGDAPVCDFKSWPGGFGTGDGSPANWITCKAAYGFNSDAEALAYDGNPVDHMQPLADAGIPLLHVVGDADAVVPVAENTAIVETRYNSFGGAINVIHKPGVGHVHGLADPSPIIDFILNAVSAEDHIPMFVPGVTISNGNFNVQFSGTTGQHYRVEYADDLTTTNIWQVAADIDPLETSPMNVSTPITNAAGFFRIHWFPW